ncbi:MAG: hypothetical protein QOH33_2017 [Paraburkholderia sp.]|nr:hypothetical protein [Paraburkholderia sp.]
MIKALIPTLVIAAAVAAPNFAFAQSNSPVTRAQVKAELAQLEAAGYNPSSDKIHYPQAIQAAEARVAAQNASSGYGGAAGGSSMSGSAAATTHPATNSEMKSIYAGS